MKKIWRQKIILSILTLAIFLMPITPALQTKKAGATNTAEATEKAEAQTENTKKETYFKVESTEIKDTSISIKVGLYNTKNNYLENNASYTLFLNNGTLNASNKKPEIKNDLIPIETNAENQTLSIEINNLTPSTKYLFIMSITEGHSKVTSLVPLITIPQIDKVIYSDNIEITTSSSPNNNDGTISGNTNSESTDLREGYGCNLLKGWPGIKGCIASFFQLFYEIASFIARLTARLLDFFIYYSTNSSSYENGFIKEGWKAVRDVVNIFFIIALLFVAIKTILSLNDGKSKRLIGYVVLIALLINFSLFFTQVIIDSSNILAKIFYNNIDSVNLKNENVTGIDGEKSISVGLVRLFNPQRILTPEVIEERGIGVIISIIIIATIITFLTALIFLSVALLFVARVISLWILMIFAPLAFISYTLPFDIPGFGHKEWWNELLKNAFLAPIFIFFLYIIVMFANNLVDIVKIEESDQGGFGILMTVIIPFIIIYFLLRKAKELAVKYSGEAGKAITTAAKVVGGAAVGVAAGGLAVAGRATIGRAGSALANSEKLKKWEKEGKFGAAALRNIGTFTSKKNMDIRGIKIAGKDLGSTGLKLNTITKTKEGGFEKMKMEKIEKRVKRAKELESGEGSENKRKASSLEAELRTAKAIKANDLSKVEKDITELRQKMQDQKSAGLDTEAALTYTKLETKQNEKKILRGIDPISGTKTSGGIADLESRLNKLNDDINAEEINSINKYAASIESMGNKTLNYIKSFGQHSGVGANIAADRIRKGVKIEEPKK